MQYHLIKCRKQHPELSLVVCPYNATHHVNPADEQEHLMSCPDRRIVEIQRYRFNDPQPGQHGALANPLIYGSSLIPKEGRERKFNPPSALDMTTASSVGTAYFRQAGKREHTRPERILGSPTGSPDQSIVEEEEEEKAPLPASEAIWKRKTDPHKPLRRPKSVHDSDVRSVSAAPVGIYFGPKD